MRPCRRRNTRSRGSTGQSAGKVAHQPGGEVLVLRIEPAASAGDEVLGERRHLRDGGAAVVGWLGARDAHLHVGEVRRHALGPRVARRSRWGRHRASPRATPALPHQLAQRRCGLPVDDHLDVVEGPVRIALRRDAPRVARRVGGGVPSVGAEVDAAREGHRVVDHHDLLMVRGAEGVVIVEGEVHRPGRAPSEAQAGHELPLHREEERVVPAQHVGLEPGAAPHQRAKEVAEHRGRRPRGAAGPELDAAVDVPAYDEDGALGLLAGADEGLEVGGRVDEDRRAARAAATPEVATDAGEGRVRRQRDQARLRRDALPRRGPRVPFTIAPYSARRGSPT